MSGIIVTALVGMMPVLADATTSGVEAPPASPPRWSLSANQAPPDASDVIDRLGRQAAGAGVSLKAIDLHLMGANWILAYSLEPLATRMLLGVPEPSDAIEAAQVVRKAQAQLEAAGKVLAALAGDGGDGEADVRGRSDRLASLRAFSECLAALWPVSAESAEQREEGLRQAASDLALVLEDDRPEIAGGALFWQAYLYGTRARYVRALDLLPGALEPPRKDDTLGFYARLLRCRFVVREQEAYAAALALLARIEERCGEWFEAEPQKEAARRAAALVRRQLTEDWARTFREADKGARATWCEESIARIDKTYFAADAPAEVLRLGRAVPAVVNLDAARDLLEERMALAVDDATTTAGEKDATDTDIVTSHGPDAATSGFEELPPGAP